MTEYTDTGPMKIGGKLIRLGRTRDIRVKVSETYFGDPVWINMRVIRSWNPGPVVLITAAIHGNELNGTGIIHELMGDTHLRLDAGSLILVPVVNVFGFESNERYMPDRRDLNRSFPGSIEGSLTSRVAKVVFDELVMQSDFGIDLHTAAVHRTNFPNIRGDLSDRSVRKIARAFGCELLVDGKGPEGCFRREASRAGCPTITIELGEPSKIEPSVFELGVRGIKNVLMELGMIRGMPYVPPYQTRVFKTVWTRAAVGGILRFHVVPGQVLRKGDPIASNYTIMGRKQNVLTSPIDGVVLSLATMPTVKPGEPVCHIALPSKNIDTIRKALEISSKQKLHHQLRTDLATNISVIEIEKLGDRD